MKNFHIKYLMSFFLVLFVILAVQTSIIMAANGQIDIGSIYKPEIYTPVTSINKNTPAVSINSYIYMTSDNRPIEVQYSFPNNTDYSDLIVVIVMPGMTRDPDGRYMNPFSYLSRVENICVITPKFSEEYFPASEYQYINVSSSKKYEEWTFNKIDSLFEDFVQRFKLKTSKYILYGHSAGGQFAHRTAIFSKSKYIDYIIAASAGNYTFLDEDKYYSSGIGNLMEYKYPILSNLSDRKVYILTGNKDNDPNADNFSPSEQGNSRYEKALNFCNSTLSYAIENGTYYNWETIIMDGIDHSAVDTIPYVLDIITGKYQSKTEQINERINNYYNANNIIFNLENEEPSYSWFINADGERLPINSFTSDKSQDNEYKSAETEIKASYPYLCILTKNSSSASEIEAFEINGDTYVKLREVAYSLNDTYKQFDINWDNINERIVIHTGRPYIQIGGERSSINDRNVEAIPLNLTVIVDDREYELAAYTINGNNYLEIHDIARIMRLNLDLSVKNEITFDMR